jgi:cadmium resistance protein CadD (predicted permease)
MPVFIPYFGNLSHSGNVVYLRVVNLTIDEEDNPSPEIARKLAQLASINGNLEKLNDTEPLPSEFDEILAQPINFARVL